VGEFEVATDGGIWVATGGKVGKARFADQDKQSYAVADNGCQLVRLVANPSVMSQCYPTFASYRSQPLFIGAVLSEMVAVSLDVKSGAGKDVWKGGAEIAVRKPDATQAARS
jgi:hypothetical protein